VLSADGVQILLFCEIRCFTRNLNPEFIRLEPANAPHTTHSGAGGIPERLPANAVGTYCPDTGHYHTPHHSLFMQHGTGIIQEGGVALNQSGQEQIGT